MPKHLTSEQMYQYLYRTEKSKKRRRKSTLDMLKHLTSEQMYQYLELKRAQKSLAAKCSTLKRESTEEKEAGGRTGEDETRNREEDKRKRLKRLEEEAEGGMAEYQVRVQIARVAAVLCRLTMNVV